MGRVLLLDADGRHAKQVEGALRAISCQTTISADLQSSISLLQRQQFDAVVVVSNPGMDWDIRVEFIRHAALRLPEPPLIVCLLRGLYRGPNERVYAARKGFKVVYEQ
jgi:hypothetical protein